MSIQEAAKPPVVEAGRAYRLKPHDPKFFEDKYGEATPVWVAEAPSRAIWPNGGWGMQDGNPACLIYAMRSGLSGAGFSADDPWYGKIGHLGELVDVAEIGEPVDHLRTAADVASQEALS